MPFLGIGEWYLNVFNSYQSSIIYSYESWISCFCCHKCNHNALMKEARGQNKLFQNASLLMCYCSFAIGQFLILNNQSEKRLLYCCLKFKSARITLRVTHIRVVFLRTYPFCDLCCAFNGISHKKLFAVFLPYIRLSCHILRAKVPTNRWLKTLNVIWDKAFSRD